jgi:hypothetical protein
MNEEANPIAVPNIWLKRTGFIVGILQNVSQTRSAKCLPMEPAAEPRVDVRIGHGGRRLCWQRRFTYPSESRSISRWPGYERTVRPTAPHGNRRPEMRVRDRGRQLCRSADPRHREYHGQGHEDPEDDKLQHVGLDNRPHATDGRVDQHDPHPDDDRPGDPASRGARTGGRARPGRAKASSRSFGTRSTTSCSARTSSARTRAS